MKALVVTPYYAPKIGGLENYARQLNIALKLQEDWEIVVATSNHDGNVRTTDIVDDIPVHRLGTMLKFSNTPLNPLWPFMLRSLIRAEKPDIILAHMPVPSMADAVALAAGRTPLVITYHAATLLKGDAVVFNTIARLYGMYEQLTLGKATKIFAVSEYVKSAFKLRDQQKTAVIPNAVWEHEIIARQQPQTVDFLFISSLDKTHSWKGLDDLITALHHYQKTYASSPHLTVMGDGNYRSHYEELVQSFGLSDSITFVGAQTGTKKQAIISSAGALISYPTTANDAFPTVLLEAWAKGVPVIAAAIGPLPTLINDKRDGILVKPHDPVALATALHDMVISTQAERSDLASYAAERTKQHYTWERQAKAVSRILLTIIEDKRAGKHRRTGKATA